MEKNQIKKTLFEFEKPLIPVFSKIEEAHRLALSGKIDLSEEIKMLEKRIESMRREIFAKLAPIQVVKVARHIGRPTTLDYVKEIFEDFVELHGDRNFGDDPAMVGGMAKLNGKPIMLIGHQKGHTTKELIERNFGMANPEGYRKALRLMKMAERWKKPIVTFVDTPGAYCGLGAEERGQGEAIARNLREMAGLTVPFITIITSEGGSGGALGIGMGNRVLMLQYAIYSVISPEGCASILFRDATRSPEAAAASKLTSKDLLELQVIDEIIKEPIGGAHNNYQETANNIKAALSKQLEDLRKLSSRELIADRYRKYRKMGVFIEG